MDTSSRPDRIQETDFSTLRVQDVHGPVAWYPDQFSRYLFDQQIAMDDRHAWDEVLEDDVLQ